MYGPHFHAAGAHSFNPYQDQYTAQSEFYQQQQQEQQYGFNPYPYQMQHALYNQQNTPFGAYYAFPQPQTFSYPQQPLHNHIQYLAQQQPVFNNHLHNQLSPSISSQYWSSSQTQQNLQPIQTINTRTYIQSSPANYLGGLPTSIEQQHHTSAHAQQPYAQNPLEGSSPDTAIVLDEEVDEPIQKQPSPPVPTNSSPPGYKKQERSFYSEEFAEVDAMGRKKRDKDGRPIRRSIESLVRRPGRPRPDLAMPSPKEGKPRVAARVAPKAMELAVQTAPEQPVLVAAEEKKEKTPSPKRSSAEAECDSEPAPKRKRARTEEVQSPISEPVSLSETDSSYLVSDDEDDGVFNDLEIVDPATPSESLAVPQAQSEVSKPASISEDDSGHIVSDNGDDDLFDGPINEEAFASCSGFEVVKEQAPADVNPAYVPELTKATILCAIARLPAGSKPQKWAPKLENIAEEVHVESQEEYNARMAKEMEAEMDEEEEEEEEGEYVAPGPRSPTPESDEDEDDDYAGNLKYKQR